MSSSLTKISLKNKQINTQIELLFVLFGPIMKDFFTYLTAGPADRDWGLFLNVAGRTQTAPYAPYPASDHPTGYYFTWESGRVLQEYQLNYITEGTGLLENKSGRILVKPGSLIITRPGDWHRYRPMPKTGWVENYIGLNGPLAEHFFQQFIFANTPAVIQCGFREEIIDTFYKIFDLLRLEEPGYQQIASGWVVKLLGHLVAIEKQKNFSGKRIEEVVRKIRFYMQEHVEDNIHLPTLAQQHHIAYPYFRKMFKKYTGVSPHQYILELKIMRAKEMLLTTERSVKEISAILGFQSIYYFSRLFKQKTGSSPTSLRKSVQS